MRFKGAIFKSAFKRGLTRLLSDRRITQGLERVIRDAIKPMLKSGQSPVRGEGRFVAYAAQRKSKEIKDKIKKMKAQGAGRMALKKERDKIKRLEETLYPLSVRGKHPNKTVRPVNLWLSGEMQRHFRPRVEKKNDKPLWFVGLSPSAPKKVKDRWEGNQGGHPHIPPRLIIPSPKKGEGFVTSIQRAIKRVFADEVKRLLGKK